MSLLSFCKTLILSMIALGLTSCGWIPDVKIWLNKIDFEVSPDANKGEAFVCHVAVAYSQDLADRLQNMDAKGYFSSISALEKTYKDSIEVFKYDMVPGRNKIDQKIKLRSYTKAKCAYIFAKYSTPGKFAESVGKSPALVIRFLPYKMEVVSSLSLEALTDKIKK